MIEGIYTALVTPLKNGSPDLDALGVLVERQVEAGVAGIVTCATTGEGSLLTHQERRSVIETVIERANKRIKVWVGTGHIATAAAVEATRLAGKLGADAALVVSPSYVKPSQDGLLAHYERIADEGGLPIIVYNVPSRTASDIEPATVGKLAAHDRIIGIKEATGSILRGQQVIAEAAGRIAVLSGDDPITVSLLVAGGQGVVCTGSNVVPKKWTALWDAWKRGDLKAAVAAQAELIGLHEALFLETNPGPAKGALYLLGLLEPDIKAPLTWPKKTTIDRLALEMKKLGLEIKAES